MVLSVVGRLMYAVHTVSCMLLKCHSCCRISNLTTDNNCLIFATRNGCFFHCQRRVVIVLSGLFGCSVNVTFSRRMYARVFLRVCDGAPSWVEFGLEVK